jgi:elongation factor G
MPRLDEIRDHPTVGYRIDKESGQIILTGHDELELDGFVIYLQSGNGFAQQEIQLNVSAPQVSYRETIAQAVTVDYTRKSPTSSGLVRLQLRMEPDLSDAAPFVSMLDPPNALSKEVEASVCALWDEGTLIGFPVVNTKATLLLLECDRPRPGNVAAAARAAAKEAMHKAGVTLLEPVMAIEVATPDKYVADIVRYLEGQRGKVLAHELLGLITVVPALVPLANMFGFSSSLIQLSHGQADYTSEYSHYAEVPRHIASSPDNNFRPAMGMRA